MNPPQILQNSGRILGPKKIALFLVLGAVVSACKPWQQSTSSVQIQFPLAKDFRAKKVAALAGPSVDYARLCFWVNVKGGIIPSTTGSCDVERGLIAGSTPPGGELSIMVDVGENYTFEIYGFLRNSPDDSCPVAPLVGWNWPVQKTYLLASQPGVAVVAPETLVTITLNLPEASQNLVVQNNWGPSCANLGSPMVEKTMGRVQLSSGTLMGSNFRVYSRVSEKKDLQKLSGTSFQIRNWKASTQ